MRNISYVDGDRPPCRRRCRSPGKAGFRYPTAHRSPVPSSAARPRKIERGVRRRGEPFVFGLDLGELEPFIEPLGFRVAEELGGSELRARFLGDRPLKIYPFARLAVAEVV
ncbi:MAG: hypothetical protein GY856_37235 [bacterium]|nr:hypothetical protein [bacterium]